MDATTYGRTLMGDSLGFHIIFALLGVGIPLLISVAEYLGIRRKDSDFYRMARHWSFLLGTLFVVGAVSGMIISNQLSILWPKFMTIAGAVVGPAFYMETFCFFIEAIFLGIYLYTWDRFKNKWTHWLCSLPLVLGAAGSSFFITAANSWMNAPAGFEFVNGEVRNVHPWAAIFNHATYTETTHSIVAYYLTTTLLFAGMHAYFILHREIRARLGIDGKTLKDAVAAHASAAKRRAYDTKVIVFTMALSAMFGLLINFTGDQSAKYIVRNEPIKLAAAEGLLETQGKAPLAVGGYYDADHRLEYAIKLPYLLSFLAYGSGSAVVKGLEAFNPDLWPPLWIHYMFDFMVFIGIGMSGVIALFFFLYLTHRRSAFSHPMLVLLFITGFSGFFAVEFGWILTEVGRQPFAINGILRTTEAFTTAPNVEAFGYIFPSLYMVLFVVTPWILRRHYRKHPLDLEKTFF